VRQGPPARASNGSLNIAVDEDPIGYLEEHLTTRFHESLMRGGIVLQLVH